jgi:hypothetical protein
MLLHDKGNMLQAKEVGLILLKQGEAEIISQNPNVLHQETYDDRLSYQNIERMISDFTDHGLFSHLNQAQLDSARQRVFDSDINSIEDVLSCFPKTIVAFDWESINLENPYEELTRNFADAGLGIFTIGGIEDRYKDGWTKTKKKVNKIKYAFTMNDKHYSTMLEFHGDWLDPEFMKLLERAMKETNADCDIYRCIDNGQEAGYLILSTPQYNYVRENYPDLIKENKY